MKKEVDLCGYELEWLLVIFKCVFLSSNFVFNCIDENGNVVKEFRKFFG